MTNILNYDLDYLNSENARWQRDEEQRRQVEKRHPDLCKRDGEEDCNDCVKTQPNPPLPFRMQYSPKQELHKTIDGNEEL